MKALSLMLCLTFASAWHIQGHWQHRHLRRYNLQRLSMAETASAEEQGTDMFIQSLPDVTVDEDLVAAVAEVAAAAPEEDAAAPFVATPPKRGERVQLGDSLPEVMVDVAATQRVSTQQPLLLADALGGGKAILVGMPGAFTPTCNDRHLPGLLGAAEAFADLNVSRVAVVTCNDRFVNSGWAAAVEACSGQNASGVLMLSDTRGELIESLGLSGDMGYGLEGPRSKRFALVLDEGVVSHVAVDEGLDALQRTSAQALIRHLDPGATQGPEAAPAAAALAVLAAATIAFQAGLFGGGVAPVDQPPAVVLQGVEVGTRANGAAEGAAETGAAEQTTAKAAERAERVKAAEAKQAAAEDRKSVV